jgi:hypothetical protein
MDKGFYRDMMVILSLFDFLSVIDMDIIRTGEEYTREKVVQNQEETKQNPL